MKLTEMHIIAAYNYSVNSFNIIIYSFKEKGTWATTSCV